MASERRRVRVRSITYQGEYINAYEVVDPEGHDLPPFTAGAHIDVFFQDGKVRQYSLCNDPSERRCYVFAVQREDHGRGGSIAIFHKVHVGCILTISEPRNNFPLVEDAERHLLLAGGVGATPMMAMIHRLRAIGADFTMHYCTRSPEKTSFHEDLTELVSAGRVILHHDGGIAKNGLDMSALLESHRPGTHLYYCGPPGFMRAAEAASAHWPKEAVHLEYFTAPSVDAAPVVAPSTVDDHPADAASAAGFQIKVASTGALYDVPNDQSIVDVLRDHGFDIETSCESGLCGTCRTRYLDGEPEHEDYVLDDEEQAEYVMICTARSRTPLLVLDL